MFLHLLRGNRRPVKYLDGSRYLQGVLKTFQGRLSVSEEFEVPRTLEVLLLFHGLSCVECFAQQNRVRALRNATAQTGTTFQIVNKLIMKAFRPQCRVPRGLPLFEVIAPYIIIEIKMIWCTVFFCV